MEKVDLELINKLLSAIHNESEDNEVLHNYEVIITAIKEECQISYIKEIKIFCRKRKKLLLVLNIYQ